MITTRIPDTEADLRATVASILSECGYSVTLSKTITATRFEPDIEDNCQDYVIGKLTRILCECSYWRGNVSKNDINLFSAVITASPAERGYIILPGHRIRFDSGNVLIVSWDEFQHAFEHMWYETYLLHRIANAADSLLPYAEPFAPAWYGDLSERDKELFLKLKNRHQLFTSLVVALSRYEAIPRHRARPTLPLAKQQLAELRSRIDAIPDAILSASG